MEPIRIVKSVVNYYSLSPGGPRDRKQVHVVLNRLPSFKYVKKGSLLLAEDSGFYNCYACERPSGSFKAFAGRKFQIPMLDGSTLEAEGQWWNVAHPEHKNKDLVSIGYSTEEELKKCFVFYGGTVEKSLLDDYKDEPIEYREYEIKLRSKDDIHYIVK